MLAIQVQMMAGNILCAEMFYGQPHCGFCCYKCAHSTIGLAWKMGPTELTFSGFCTSYIFSFKYISLEGTRYGGDGPSEGCSLGIDFKQLREYMSQLQWTSVSTDRNSFSVACDMGHTFASYLPLWRIPAVCFMKELEASFI